MDTSMGIIPPYPSLRTRRPHRKLLPVIDRSLGQDSPRAGGVRLAVAPPPESANSVGHDLLARRGARVTGGSPAPAHVLDAFFCGALRVGFVGLGLERRGGDAGCPRARQASVSIHRRNGF